MIEILNLENSHNHGSRIGMNEEDIEYPDSAISSWSGFVYQGKVALYHCLKLIDEGDVNFELQLDSTDDFAIYSDGLLSSAHQVKAKVGKYRSAYVTALKKSAKIELDRVEGIARYFHVSVEITDSTDYVDDNGETVKFYAYGDNKYCGLGDIETVTKSLIAKICKERSIDLSTNLIESNYCVVSDKISSKAICIHNQIQINGDSEKKAAYENRISGKDILYDILNKNPYDDKEYFAISLKTRLLSYLEDKLDNSLPHMTDAVYKRVCRLYEYIQKTDPSELKTLCQLMKPSERFSQIQKGDIRLYSGLIQALGVDPILDKIPHYLDKEKKFYIPTALSLVGAEAHDECTSDILGEMKSNNDLLALLFEYNNLIASRSSESFMIDTKYTASANLSEPETQQHIDSNIVKTLCISIVTKEEAEDRLNDH